MPDPYEELDVFGRPKSRVGGVPYVTPDDELIALQNYVLNLRAKEDAIESGARTVRKPKEIKKEGKRTPAYVHEYDPGYTASEEARLLDERDPVRFMPVVRQGAENVRAIYNEGFETPGNIFQKVTGAPAPHGLWRLQTQPTFEDRWNNNLIERTQTWPEKMVRSGASLPADVMSGRVISGPGLRATDFSDIPGAPNPLGPMIERTQDLAGLAMGGSVVDVARSGAQGGATLGTGFVPKIKGPGAGIIDDATMQWLRNTYLANDVVPRPTTPFAPRTVEGNTHNLRVYEESLSKSGRAMFEPDSPVAKTGKQYVAVTPDGRFAGRSYVSKQDALKEGQEFVNKHGPKAGVLYKTKPGSVILRADDEVGGAFSAARNAQRGLTNEFGGGNVPPSIARNIGRETMPEILARQRASEGMEAAIRDPETKKLYTGMWHEEVLDKIAKDRGVPKDQLPTNLVKGYVNDRGRFISEEQAERASQNKSKTAMFRADDEVGAAVAALHATEGKTPELKVGEANLPAVIPQGGGLMAPGSAINPISNRRGFLRGARDMMAAASNANKIVSMAEKLGQTPIPKMPKVPLKEIWKTEGAEIPEHVREGALENFWDNFRQDFEERHPEYEDGHIPKGKEKAYDRDVKEFEKDHTESIDDMTAEAFADWKDSEGGGTQFSHHQLPGATNYREHLMQMPEGHDVDTRGFSVRPAEEEFYGTKTKGHAVFDKDGKRVTAVFKNFKPEEEATTINNFVKGGVIKNREPFYGDWDEPDIIGHSRVNDRQISNVGKSLHIEEIGSQVHEKGQKYGYASADTSASRLKAIDKELKEMAQGNIQAAIKKNPSIEERYRALQEEKSNIFQRNSTPDLPFKKTHVDIAVNRMLHEAATQDYDAVSWTPHELQKKNYGNDSNKEVTPRIEALAKKYGGKVEKHKVEVERDKDGKPVTEDVYHVKLTPEMKRIFGHDDFSMFPKEQATETSKGFKLRSDSEAGAAVGALRNATAPTFYSGLGRTIERAPFETATPSQWAKHLRDTVGERQAEEFEHVGLEGKVGPLKEVKQEVQRPAQGALEEWKKANPKQRPPKELIDAASNENKRLVEQKIQDRTKEAPLTKAELLAHVKENQPKFKEIVKRADEETSIQARAQEIMNEEHPEIKGDHPRYYDYFDEAVHRASDELEGSATKYSDYQLPGGTNYREHLLTMPSKLEEVRKEIQQIKGHLYNTTNSEKDRVLGERLDRLETLEEQLRGRNEPAHFSSHWPEDPNVIVHTRMNDRNLQVGSGPNGYTMKSLHAEEFQSDLHQEGRKKGYKGEAGKLLNKTDRTPQEEARMGAIVEHGTKGGVPNFPFKKSWPDLAIKRWLREAVDNDYDAISWTPGEAQRDRFQLGHHLYDLSYEKNLDGTYWLGGTGVDGKLVKINRDLPIKEENLSQYVGDAVAEKIKKDEGRKNERGLGYATLDNQDLKVGGEGLVSFYDKTVKGKVEALVEKFGGKVEKHSGNQRAKEIDKKLKELDEAERSTDPRVQHLSDVERMKQIFALRNERRELSSPDDVWSVKLTPEMKAAIKREGFPLFSAGPVLTPVDHDPFDKKEAKKPKLQPVEHDPFAQPTPDMGGKLNKLISATSSYRPRPQPIQNGFGTRLGR